MEEGGKEESFLKIRNIRIGVKAMTPRAQR